MCMENGGPKTHTYPPPAAPKTKGRHPGAHPQGPPPGSPKKGKAQRDRTRQSHSHLKFTIGDKRAIVHAQAIRVIGVEHKTEKIGVVDAFDSDDEDERPLIEAPTRPCITITEETHEGILDAVVVNR